MTEIPESNPVRGKLQENEHPADGTLGGYLALHDRPPGFEGIDGHPYTVSLEVEKTPDLPRPFSGYLVFPRWADTGIGIVGHLETPLLCHGKTREEVAVFLEALTLLEVNALLTQAIHRRGQETE
jgi:hypothetical protein